MRISGGAELHAPSAQVWQALTDPDVLEQAIPGCESLEPLSPGAARLTVTAAVGATTGICTGKARVTGRNRPESLVIEAALAGEPGTITAVAHLRLAEGGDGATHASYEADAEVTGPLAAVGQSLLAAAAARLAAQFFESVAALLAGQPERTENAAPAHENGHGRASAPDRGKDMGAGAPPAGGRRGGGFAAGFLAGTAIGIAAAKLGTLIARRNR